MLRASASAVPTRAVPSLPCMAGAPPDTPFQLKNKFGGGKSQKKAKGAAGGVRAGLPAQAARLRVTLFAGNGF